jgi:chemotaxis signal transduction protein
MSPAPDAASRSPQAAATTQAADTSLVPRSSHPAVVVIRVDPAEFALPITSVHEVLRAPPITPVPFVHPAVCGVASVRGSIVPVVDLGMRLFRRPVRSSGPVVLVLPGDGGERIGLRVDAVAGLIWGDTAEVLQAPAEAEASLRPGWAVAVLVPEPGRLVTMLDVSAVLATAGSLANAEHGGTPQPPPQLG